MFCWYILSIGLIILLLHVNHLQTCAGQKADYTRFANSRVYKINIKDAFQLAKLNALIDEMGLEQLIDFRRDGGSDVVVNPEQQQLFEATLKKFGMEFRTTIENFMKTLERRIGVPPIPEMEWTQYHHVDVIFRWLREQAIQHSPIATLLTIGRTFERRPIYAMWISRKRNNRAIFVECNIHSIEWISSATCTCFLNNLLNSNSTEVQELVRNYDWIIVPVMNPDGLAYTHDVTPLWRKNRRPNGGFSPNGNLCIGTDMNRNMNFHWKEAGFNTNYPCSNFYGGPAPESEPEIQALRNFVNSLPRGLTRMYLAVHSFSNKVLLPFGHTTEIFPHNFNQMLNISKGFADAARIRYGTNFTYGTSGKILFPVSGTTKDWAYGVQNIQYSATIELRDEGEYGFFLPPDQILEVCAEFTDGIVGLVKAAQHENLFD